MDSKTLFFHPIQWWRSENLEDTHFSFNVHRGFHLINHNYCSIYYSFLTSLYTTNTNVSSPRFKMDLLTAGRLWRTRRRDCGWIPSCDVSNVHFWVPTESYFTRFDWIKETHVKSKWVVIIKRWRLILRQPVCDCVLSRHPLNVPVRSKWFLTAIRVFSSLKSPNQTGSHRQGLSRRAFHMNTRLIDS